MTDYYFWLGAESDAARPPMFQVPPFFFIDEHGIVVHKYDPTESQQEEQTK
jgi:hypothetical protein